MSVNSSNQDELKIKGWSKMKTILDQEMPERKKRRPIVWMILSLASIFLGFLGWKGINQRVLDRDFAKATVPSIISKLEKANTVPGQTHEIVKNKALVTNRSTEINKLLIDQNQANGLRNQAMEAYPLQIEKRVEDESDQVYSNKSNVTKTVMTNEMVANALPIVTNNSMVSNNDEHIMAALPSIQNSLEWNQVMDDVKPQMFTITKAPPSSTKWDFTIHGGVGSYSITGIELFYLGAEVKRHLNQRLGLSSGLYYQALFSHKKSNLVEESAVANDPDVHNQDSTIPGFGLENGLNNSSLGASTVNKSPFQTIGILRLPIYVHFNISSKLSLWAGPQINYLANISSELTETNISKDINDISINNDKISRWYGSANAGVNMQLWRKWGASMWYNIDNKIYYGENQLRSSFLLGLSYRI